MCVYHTRHVETTRHTGVIQVRYRWVGRYKVGSDSDSCTGIDRHLFPFLTEGILGKGIFLSSLSRF